MSDDSERSDAARHAAHVLSAALAQEGGLEWLADEAAHQVLYLRGFRDGVECALRQGGATHVVESRPHEPGKIYVRPM
jgi:hypothetical protein